MMTKMTQAEMLEYITKMNGTDFGKDKEQEAKDTDAKLRRLLETFGFTHYGSPLGQSYGYGVHYERERKRGGDTVQWFRLMIGKYDYIQVSLGYHRTTKDYGRGHNKKTYVVSIKGVAKYEVVNVPLNPRTNRPWKAGDIDYSKPLHPMLTRDGNWWTGD